MDKLAVSRNLKEIMKQEGLDGIDLCSAGGWEPVTVSNWLAGKRIPSAYAVRRLAKILGTTMEQITEGMDE